MAAEQSSGGDASGGEVSFGWIMQPGLYFTPEGVDPRDIRLARDMISANERHVELARDTGFDTVWVEDHMGWGERSHLECLTTLAWLAGRHPGLRWGTMVCSDGFRNPAYLAKVAVNLQLLTEGRFILGLGAGNNGAEHAEFGYPFPSTGERLDGLEETIRIARSLWSGGRQTFEGERHRITNAVVAPVPQPAIPIMVGGGGERRTLRIVAELADSWCADVGPVEQFARKSAVLDRHCEDIRRDPRTVERTQVAWVSIDDGGQRPEHWPDVHIVRGDAGAVTDELLRFRRAGVDHFQIRFMDYPSTAGLERFAADVLPVLEREWA
jgi:alkanesulfonate monooxygenase SsuD/methylene tetrahydromethanopterin reductase-like flavin-dependent oxidoreductase (luciferase family)